MEQKRWPFPKAWPHWMGDHPRAGEPWGDAEDIALAEAFGIPGCTAVHLAKIHGRSVGAINSRLEKLAYKNYEPAATLRSQYDEQVLARLYRENGLLQSRLHNAELDLGNAREKIQSLEHQLKSASAQINELSRRPAESASAMAVTVQRLTRRVSVLEERVIKPPQQPAAWDKRSVKELEDEARTKFCWDNGVVPILWKTSEGKLVYSKGSGLNPAYSTANEYINYEMKVAANGYK